MWISMKKCAAVPLQEIFLLILCVATLSFLLTYQLEQAVVYVNSEQNTNQEYTRSGRASSENIKANLFGRSLRMHAANIERVEPRPSSLLSRLLKLEETLLKYTRRRKIGVIGLQEATDDDDIMHLKRTAKRFGQDIDLLQENHQYQSKKVVIQGNYSMILCAGQPESCPEVIHSSAGEPQRMNRLVAIEKQFCSSRRLCEVSGFLQNHTENNERYSNPPCHTVSRSGEGINEVHVNTTYPIVIVVQINGLNIVLHDTTVFSVLKRGRDVNISTIWTFQVPLLTFQSGPLLRLHLLVTSIIPLRVYLYSSIATGPVEALADSSLLEYKTSYEDVLQFVGEKYGLAASSYWWNTIQILFMKSLVSAEMTSENAHKFFKQSSRSFGAYTVDVLCVGVRKCYILQIEPVLSQMANYKHDVLEPVFQMMTSEKMVAMDIATAFEEKRNDPDFKLCNNGMSADCLSDAILIYFLDDRREALSNTGLIKIYPTVSSSVFTPFLNDIEEMPFSFMNRYTADIHHLLMSLNAFYTKTEGIVPGDFYVSDDSEMYDTKMDTDYAEPQLYDAADQSRLGLSLEPGVRIAKNYQTSCTEDSRHYKDIGDFETEPALSLQQYSQNDFYAVADYALILFKLWASALRCSCEVRFGHLFEPSRPTNFTLGLGENTIKMLIVDTTYPEPRLVRTIQLHIFRESRGLSEDDTELAILNACTVKQECSLPFCSSCSCGLQNTSLLWKQFQHQLKPVCDNGDVEGGWSVPCTDCNNENSCYWKHAKWQPDTCSYVQFSEKLIQQCLFNKKLLFLGDSTNRGIMHSIIEKINGSLSSMDKTHSVKSYRNLNGGKTDASFAYYPHFWLPANHRPKFHKILYQLIKRSFPLENNSNTILVVGGVHWLARKHVDLIKAALQRTGLSNITKIVKGVGAGFHQNIKGVRFVNADNQAKLLQRERHVLDYAKQNDFKVVATFNMTMARYKDFTQGKCACHFHRISKQNNTHEDRYTVEGDINFAYSQILLHNICNLS